MVAAFVSSAAPAHECQGSTLGNNFITTGHARPQVKSLFLAPRTLLLVIPRLTRKAPCLPSSAFLLARHYSLSLLQPPRPPPSAALLHIPHRAQASFAGFVILRLPLSQCC